jgi:transcriptional regulator of acetoin/glycerol metabolism
MFAKALEQEDLSHFWTELSDVPFSMRKKWNETVLAYGFNASTNYIQTRLSNLELQLRKKPLDCLLITVTSEWDKISAQFSKPHLFICTDTSGTALEMTGTESVILKLKECNIGLGTSFSLEHLGINGISLAMEVQNSALVKGNEHHLELFEEWSCVCQPIIINGVIQGYLDLSIHSDEDFTWAFVLLGKLVADIEEKCAANDPNRKQKEIMDSLSQCGLSSREVDIAWRWLNNQNTLQIAAELYITEGTVRNHIKKVYAKTGVCEKGRFMRKFV